MLICPIDTVADLLPHSGSMVLLDSIEEYGQEYLIASAHVGKDHVFLQNNQSIPAWTMIEIMAQGVAALDGCHAHNEKRAVRLGFLLGTRKLELFVDEIPVGTHLRICNTISIRDQNGFAVCDSELTWTHAPADLIHRLPENHLLAKAALNVFSPPDIQTYLENKPTI